MTRAVGATAFGGPEVLAVIQTPAGSPGPGEALVSVRAAGTNPIDYKLYSGAIGDDPARLPMRLGFEAAGVVTEVADGAEGPSGPVRVGDEVIAYRITGAYADDVTVPLASVIRKPSTLSFQEASGMMLTGVTAAHALGVVGARAGRYVLIHGASGGVGLMAVQLAVAAGARVIGTASESGHELLREFGAEPVLYGAGLAERARALAPGGVDAAIDCFGGDEALDTSLALVADRGKIVPWSPAGGPLTRGSRSSAARRAPTPGPRSGPPPGSSWPGWPKRESCGSSWPRPIRWPRPPPRTGRWPPALPTARSRWG